MEKLIYTPPIVFLIFIVTFFLCSNGFSRYSHQATQRKRTLDAYACGQRDVQHYVNPDYSQFFKFAYFFTIMHVLVLVVATAPYETLFLPIVYIMSGILAMVIIFKR